MFNLQSYDVPVEIRDTINAMDSIESVIEYRDSVKCPAQCSTGDPDLKVWWACQSVIESHGRQVKLQEEGLKESIPEWKIRCMDWATSDEYDD